VPASRFSYAESNLILPRLGAGFGKIEQATMLDQQLPRAEA
jgi:hypothetical protein